MMTSRISKFVLTSHITFSVGWFGAVAVFLALAITAFTTQDVQLVRSCCLAMSLCTWFVIVPFCLTSLFTGIVQAIGTKWGLFKHYWIVVKLFLTVMATLLLFLHLQPITYLAEIASGSSFSNSQYDGKLLNLISKAGAAVLALLAITTISVYKPWGKIQLAQRENNDFGNLQNPIEKTKKSGTFYVLIGVIIIVAIFIISHLFGSMNRH